MHGFWVLGNLEPCLEVRSHRSLVKSKNSRLKSHMSWWVILVNHELIIKIHESNQEIMNLKSRIMGHDEESWVIDHEWLAVKSH